MPSSALARSRKPRRGTELVCEMVFRPLAHPLVLVFARLRVPPPVVVVAAGVAGIAGCGRARARLSRRGRAPRPAEDAARQRRRPARAAHGPDERLRPLSRLRGRSARERSALRRARLAGWAARPLALAGFLALTSVLSLNFNAERLSRAASRGARGRRPRDRAPAACLRPRLRAAGPARGVDRRAAAGAGRDVGRLAARESRHVDAACCVWTADGTRTPTRVRLAGARRAGRHRARAPPAGERRRRRSHEQRLRAARSRRRAGRDLTAGRLDAPRAATRPRSSRRSGSISTRPARARRRGGSSEALFDATAGYDGDPKLRTRLPDRAAGRRRGAPRADRRRPGRLLRALRAPRAPVPRPCPHRLRRRRRDPRHLEAHAPRAALRAPLHRAGAARRGDRRRPPRARRRARRRGQARGGAHVHRDARRRGGRLASP